MIKFNLSTIYSVYGTVEKENCVEDKNETFLK